MWKIGINSFFKLLIEFSEKPGFQYIHRVVQPLQHSNFRAFLSSQREALCPLAETLPFSQPEATSALLFVPIDLPILSILYK